MCRADTKVGFSEPMLPRRRGKDHQIKATPGITGWFCPSVHSDGKVRHLDVGSTKWVALEVIRVGRFTSQKINLQHWLITMESY